MFGQLFQEVSELFGSEGFVAFAGQDVFTVFVELGSRTVHRQGHVFAQLVACCFYRFSDNSQRFGVGTQVWCVAAFVTYSSVQAFGLQHFRQVMENFRTDTNGFFQGFRANRLNHEFLNVDVVVSVLAAVDDVHHRQWHREFAWGAVQLSDVLIQRHTFRSCSRFSRCQGNRQNGVSAELGFVLSTVQVDHDLVDVSLVFGIFAQYCLSDRAVYCSNGFQYAFTQETRLVTVTQFQCFTGTGRST